jgi:hypothetical protein
MITTSEIKELTIDHDIHRELDLEYSVRDKRLMISQEITGTMLLSSV